MKKLSPTQEYALTVVRDHGELIRRPGGFWTAESVALKPDGVPMWHLPPRTILSLLDLDMLAVSRRMKGGDPWGVKVVMDVVDAYFAEHARQADQEPTTHGRKGGRGATAGRKAETIAAEGFSKRVFFGQRILVVVKGKNTPPLVRAAPDAETAQEWVDFDGRHMRERGEFEYAKWMWATTVNGEPFTPDVENQ